MLGGLLRADAGEVLIGRESLSLLTPCALEALRYRKCAYIVYRGPRFQQVEEIRWQDMETHGGFRPRSQPLLVKGALDRWPASQRWTFERLAQLRRQDGSEVVTSFQNGLVERGVTRQPVIQPTAPYLRALARAAAEIVTTRIDDIGLLPNRRRRQLIAGESFHLDWNYLRTFTPDRVYLAQWYILNEFPQLRADFEIARLWPGLRRTWEYTFIGPANTVTGLHYRFSEQLVLPDQWRQGVSAVSAGTKGAYVPVEEI